MVRLSGHILSARGSIANFKATRFRKMAQPSTSEHSAGVIFSGLRFYAMRLLEACLSTTIEAHDSAAA